MMFLLVLLRIFVSNFFINAVYLTQLAFLGVISAIVWNFLKKRFQIGFMNIILLIGNMVVAFFAVGFLMFGPSEDGFADDLTIPKNIEISEPIQNSTDSWLLKASESRDAFQTAILDHCHCQFRLLKGMQPGMYRVEYLLNPREPGFVYLKAFEVTKGTPLSEKHLKADTMVRMSWSPNPTDRFYEKAGFMIYEGDWGKPYAARFEVWLKPDSGKTERKLAERIYKIEGWQR